ncbi:MAG: hypothetical protein IPI30_19155 [Saprospiraceae bacterium]|nr:hypothetical protein [Candidatus Vicinibacter affinis]
MPFNLRQYQIFLILITGLLISNPTKAQKEEAKWDVAKPDLPTKSFYTYYRGRDLDEPGCKS